MAIVKNDSVIDQEWITLDAEADLPPGRKTLSCLLRVLRKNAKR